MYDPNVRYLTIEEIEAILDENPTKTVEEILEEILEEREELNITDEE